jgi:hypothetical protein
MFAFNGNLKQTTKCCCRMNFPGESLFARIQKRLFANSNRVSHCTLAIARFDVHVKSLFPVPLVVVCVHSEGKSRRQRASTKMLLRILASAANICTRADIEYNPKLFSVFVRYDSKPTL